MTNNKQFKKLINLNIDEFMNKIPKVGCILGLDLGEKRIGIAISDAVLKRYWLINKVRGRAALGYTGPRSFATRADGTELPVVARDYSSYIGLRHNELDYYTKSRHTANIMADLINDTDDTKNNDIETR